MQDDVTIKCLGFYSQFWEALDIFQDILIKYVHSGVMKLHEFVSQLLLGYTCYIWHTIFCHVLEHINDNFAHICHFTRKRF